MCFQTSLGTPSQLVPFVRCEIGLRCESVWDLLFFTMFVELVLLDLTFFSRAEIGKVSGKHEPNTSKTIALHRHVALFPVISGPCVLISDDPVSLFRPELRPYLCPCVCIGRLLGLKSTTSRLGFGLLCT